MRTFSRPITATPKNVPTIIGTVAGLIDALGLQAPESNTSTIFFGTKNEQPFELRPGANAMLPINSADDVYIMGTPPDTLAIGLF